jgi:hypothetical protein
MITGRGKSILLLGAKEDSFPTATRVQSPPKKTDGWKDDMKVTKEEEEDKWQ